MTSGTVSFDRFTLDPANRLLRRDGAPVELSARYLDALSLMVRHPGGLVSKDRFLDEVWHGVPVTDEALTQCIKTLRRTLGDNAAAPRFIETVPKHGYRFIALVAAADGEFDLQSAAPAWRPLILLGGAGAIGGGMAGLVGGLFYGVAGVARQAGQGSGELSVLLVLVCLCILAGLIGGAGVGLGIAASGVARGRALPWSIVGGALGGLIVGAAAKLVGLDAFSLLVGRSPGDITGAGEGALLGAAAGLAAWFGSASNRPLAQVAVVAGLVGGAAGLVIALTGGTLMGGSLDALAQGFPESRITMDRIAALLGEPAFGPLTRAFTSMIEAALFTVGCVGALTIARRGT